MYVRFSRCICLFLSCVLLEPVYSAQSSMCDLILQIDKERAMCHTQIDNNTTGMWSLYVILCACLVLLYFGGCHYFVTKSFVHHRTRL
ncbi:hypothetical protein XENORESO_001188 [Xenotaenia resolanae]|uniref:Uncharacterized protein n=1 Tax=Xenotaenia resolanae TaxID=208358 RepID=A0ABV0W1V5_9TELE